MARPEDRGREQHNGIGAAGVFAGSHFCDSALPLNWQSPSRVRGAPTFHLPVKLALIRTTTSAARASASNARRTACPSLSFHLLFPRTVVRQKWRTKTVQLNYYK